MKYMPMISVHNGRNATNRSCQTSQGPGFCGMRMHNIGLEILYNFLELLKRLVIVDRTNGSAHLRDGHVINVQLLSQIVCAFLMLFFLTYNQ